MEEDLSERLSINLSMASTVDHPHARTKPEQNNKTEEVRDSSMGKQRNKKKRQKNKNRPSVEDAYKTISPNADKSTESQKRSPEEPPPEQQPPPKRHTTSNEITTTASEIFQVVQVPSVVEMVTSSSSKQQPPAEKVESSFNQSSKDLKSLTETSVKASPEKSKSQATGNSNTQNKSPTKGRGRGRGLPTIGVASELPKVGKQREEVAESKRNNDSHQQQEAHKQKLLISSKEEASMCLDDVKQEDQKVVPPTEKRDESNKRRKWSGRTQNEKSDESSLKQTQPHEADKKTYDPEVSKPEQKGDEKDVKPSETRENNRNVSEDQKRDGSTKRRKSSDRNQNEKSDESSLKQTQRHEADKMTYDPEVSKPEKKGDEKDVKPETRGNNRVPEDQHEENRFIEQRRGRIQGRGNFQDRGRGNFQDRGRGNFQDRGRGNFQDRGRGNFHDRGRGNFHDRGRGNWQVQDEGRNNWRDRDEGNDWQDHDDGRGRQQQQWRGQNNYRGGERGGGRGGRGRGRGGAAVVPLKRPGQLPDFIEEIEDDLFNCDNDVSLAHCVSADFVMGKGVAVEFKRKFGKVGELLDQRKRPGEVAFLKSDLRFVYYLVTKSEFHKKPTYASMARSLMELKVLAMKHKITKLAMPRIGSGLDLLDWNEVLDTICEIFKDAGIKITVYVHNPKKR